MRPRCVHSATRQSYFIILVLYALAAAVGRAATVDPIVRMGSKGPEILEPGALAWRSIVSEPVDESSRRTEKLALRGDTEVTAVVTVRSEADLKRAQNLGIQLPTAWPTVSKVAVTLRQFYALRDLGIFCEESITHEPQALKVSQKPSGRVRLEKAPAGSNSEADGPILSEDFETSVVPGPLWSATDLTSEDGLDFWGDIPSPCADVHSGSWSVDAAGHGDRPCHEYDNSQIADLQHIGAINVSAYSVFQVSFWVNYNTENNFDFLSFQAGGSPNPTTPILSMSGSSGGWIQKQVTFDNSSHAFNTFYIRFLFSSDDVITVPGGVYIDDITVTPLPNLTYTTPTTPTQWSGPIVPATTPFTTTASQSLQAGQPTFIDWAIRNTTAGTASNVAVDYYLDGQLIGGESGLDLSGNEEHTREDWLYTVPTEGAHTLRMVIDTTNVVQETSDADNGYSATFTWFGADLVVDSMNVTIHPPLPSPPALAPSLLSEVAITNAKMGQTVDIAVKIRNRGNQTTVGSTRLDWYRDRGSPPPPGTLGDQSQNIGPLAANTTQTITFTATGTKAETWRMYAYVNPTNAVSETKTTNNILGPHTLAWDPRLIYVTGTFFYDDSLLGDNSTTPCNNVMVLDTNDSDAKDDTLAAASVCCWDTGRFVVGPIINEDTDGDHSFLDLMVRVSYRTNEACWSGSFRNSWAVRMIHADTTASWYFDSDTTLNFNGPGDTLDVGLLKPTSYGDRWALHMFKVAVERGWSYARAALPDSVPVPVVAIRWEPGFPPPAAQSSHSGTRIDMAGDIGTPGSYRPDEWDDAVLMHEYGHNIGFWGGFGTDFFAADDNMPHYVDAPDSSTNTAWKEGWAWFYAAAALGTTDGKLTNRGLVPSGGSTANTRFDLYLETDSVLIYANKPTPVWTPQDVTFRISANEKGPLWEACVAGALYDIIDSHDDNPNGDAFADSLSDAFKPLYEALKASTPYGSAVQNVFNARDWYESSAANPQSDIRKFGLAQRVFQEHGILGGPTIVGVEASPPAPSIFLQAAPNPFNPIVRIAFYLPGKTRASLRIFDVQGRLVRTLVDQTLSFGLHEVRWDGSSEGNGPASTGVYFCRLEAGGRELTRKLTLIR